MSETQKFEQTENSENKSFRDEVEFEKILQKKSDEFEKAIIQEKNPLKRAIARRNFYTKQEEIRQDRKRFLNSLSKDKSQTNEFRYKKKIENRIFEAGFADNKRYRSPIITNEIKEEQDKIINFVEKEGGSKSYPCFLGEDGTLYDINYLPIIPDKQLLEKKRGKISSILNSSKKIENSQNQTSNQKEKFLKSYEFSHDPELYQNQPSPESFDTFEEFEEALVQWANEVQKKLGYLQLPRIMGRHYYRPLVKMASLKGNDIGEGVEGVLNEGGDKIEGEKNVGKGEGEKIEGKGEENEKSGNEIKRLESKGNIIFSEEKEENLNEFEFISQTGISMEETWESHLIPLEPKPEFYETFEEYEKAMIRWSIVCLGLDFLPPHPAQFQKLLGLKLIRYPKFPIPDVVIEKQEQINEEGEENKGNEEENKMENVENLKVDSKKNNLENVVISNDSLKNQVEKSKEIIVLKEWEKLSNIFQKHISEKLQNLQKKKNESISPIGTFFCKLYPKIHGCFASNNEIKRVLGADQVKFQVGKKLPDEIKSVREWIINQRQEKSLSSFFADNSQSFYSLLSEELKHQIPSRLINLSKEEINKSHDCEDKYREDVVFKTPSYDIGQISASMISKSSYSKFIQIILKKMEKDHDFEKFYSWFHPKETVNSSNIVKDLSNILMGKDENPDSTKKEDILNLFKYNCYLDYFVQFLNKNLKKTVAIKRNNKQETVKTHRSFLNYACSYENFVSILNLFHTSNSRLIHAKVSDFVLEFLKTDSADGLLKEMVEKNEIENLYLIALSVQFYDEVQAKLFKYKQIAQVLIKDYFKDEQDFIRQILVVYYLHSICISLVDEDKSFPAVYPNLIKYIENYIDKIIKYLQDKPKFLQETLWNLFGNKSIYFCELGEFVLKFFFDLSFKEVIKNLLKSKETNLVQVIRAKSSSIISHVRKAVASIFPILEQKKWISILVETYSQATFIVKDIVTTAPKSLLDSQPQLISSLVLDFLTKVMDVNEDPTPESEQLIKGIIETKTFERVLKEVIDQSHEKRMNQGTIMGSIFLSKFMKYLICNKLVGSSSVLSSSSANIIQNPKNSQSQIQIPSTKLLISEKDVTTIVDFICNENVKNRKAYKPRMYMLECLRYLFKCPEIFELTKKNLNFNIFYKIYEICKDGIDMNFNRNCWRFFYQLIKNYPQQSIDILKQNIEKSNSSTQANIFNFLDLICSPDANIIILTNSVHFFNKIFKLVDPQKQNSPYYVLQFGKIEEGDEIGKEKNLKSKKGFNTPPKDPKEYEKSFKTLIDFINNKKKNDAFHQVYVKLTGKSYNEQSESFKGWAFQSLVGLFDTFTNSNFLKQKKLTITSSTGLTHINNILSGIIEEKK